MDTERYLELVQRMNEFDHRLSDIKIPETAPLSMLYGSALMRMMLLPGLRGLWPCSVNIAGTTSRLTEISGQVRHLDSSGDPTFGIDGPVPYVNFDGTGDYFSATDSAGFSITGTEAYMENPGLTMGGWWYITDHTTGHNLMTKWSGGGNASYAMSVNGADAGDPCSMAISDDGTNWDAVYTTVASNINAWNFVAGRFDDADTGEELAIWMNGVKYTDTTTRASIYDSTAAFQISGQGGGATALFTGKASMVFLVASAVPDTVMDEIYKGTKLLFS